MDIIKQRLLSQQITRHNFNDAAQLVKWFGAVQAQDYAGAKWALSLRLNNAKDKVIEQALTDGKILRTHVMRPTWHFVNREDIRWMLALTAPRINAGNASRYRQLELDNKILNKCHDIIINALEGNKQLTRDELIRLLNQEGVRTNDDRATHIMLHAELDALVCSGARKGSRFTYALVDERIPKISPLDRDEALARLTETYFASHGPATMHDFAWWSGLTLADVKKGVAIAGAKLNSITVKQYQYWFAANMPEAGKMNNKTYLLPNYDEYVVGYADRDILSAASQINSRDNVLFSNTIIVKGKVAGVWKRAIKKDTVLLQTEIAEGADLAQLQKAAGLYGKHLGKKVILSA